MKFGIFNLIFNHRIIAGFLGEKFVLKHKSQIIQTSHQRHLLDSAQILQVRTVGENNNGAPKIPKNYFAIKQFNIQIFILQYWTFLLVELSLFPLNLCYQFSAFYLDCSHYSYCCSKYCNSNSCRSFTLLKAIAKNFCFFSTLPLLERNTTIAENVGFSIVIILFTVY